MEEFFNNLGHTLIRKSSLIYIIIGDFNTKERKDTVKSKHWGIMDFVVEAKGEMNQCNLHITSICLFQIYT